GEIPPRPILSEPRPLPSFPAPEPSPEKPLPGPLPRPMPVPPPDPPNPLLGPPEGDNAKDPAPPLPGTPTLEPGWLETTTTVSEPTPPHLGGEEMSPTSSDKPTTATQ